MMICGGCGKYVMDVEVPEHIERGCNMPTNAEKLWDLIYPVLTDKYKRVEGEIDGWSITAYKVITTIRIDLKPVK